VEAACKSLGGCSFPPAAGMCAAVVETLPLADRFEFDAWGFPDCKLEEGCDSLPTGAFPMASRKNETALPFVLRI